MNVFAILPILHLYPEDQIRLILADLKRRGIALGFEAGVLTNDQTCGTNVEGYGILSTLDQMRRIKQLGGEIEYLAVDEPVWHTMAYPNGPGCYWPVRRTAANAAQNVAAIRAIFPNIKVGLEENPDVPDFGAAGTVPLMVEFMDAWREYFGEPLAFTVFEVNGNTDWQTAIPELRKATRARGIPFALFYRGWGNSPSNDDWMTEARLLFERYETRMDAPPESAFFYSWDNYPDHVLPETNPGAFTWLINSYFRDRSSLTMTANGTRVSGRLTDSRGAPVPGADVAIGVRQSIGRGITGECGVHMTVPAATTRSVLQIYAGHHDGTDLDVSSIRVTPSAGGSPVTFDFTHGLTGWTMAADRTVEPVISQNTLQIRTTGDQYLWLNLTLPLTPGASYDVRLNTRVSASSVGGGSFRVIFLNSANTTTGAKYIPFEPAVFPLAQARTAADGTFQANLDLPANLRAAGVVAQADYAGSDTRWPATSSVPVTTAPAISLGGLVSAASFRDIPLAPGSWFTIFGQNLGDAGTWSGPETATLGGARVTVCGQPAPISYNSGPVRGLAATTWQLNVLVPDSVAGRTSCPVVVSANGQDATATMNLSAAASELFAANLPGGALPVVTHADYSLIGPPTAGLRTASPGDTVMAWGTGKCTGPVIQIGGKSAKILFAQRVASGLCQTNFVVPEGLGGMQTLTLAGSSYFLWLDPAPPAPPFTGWQFSEANLDGWSSLEVSGMRVESGHVSAQTTGTDPRIFTPFVVIPAAKYRRVAIRMSVSENSSAKLYWMTSTDTSFSDDKATPFTVQPGGMRDYVLQVGQNAAWKDTVLRLRLDPSIRTGVDVQVESIVFLP